MFMATLHTLAESGWEGWPAHTTLINSNYSSASLSYCLIAQLSPLRQFYKTNSHETEQGPFSEIWSTRVCSNAL